MKKQERFTREEADKLIGRRVRLLVKCSDVPKGTIGKIVRAEELEPNGFELIIEWEGGAHPMDWFTKEEFDLALGEE